MLIYNSLLLFFVLFSVIDILTKKKSFSLYLPILLPLIFITALRGNGGTDFSIYELYFNALPDIIYNYGYGYLALNKMVSYLGDYHLLILITSFLSISLQAYYLYKETQYPSVALLIFFSSSFILLNFILIRQAIAVGLVLAALLFYINKRVYISILLSTLSVLFHETAFFVLILFFILKKTPRNISYTLLILLIISIPFLSDIVILLNNVTINNQNVLNYINDKTLPSLANLVEITLAGACYFWISKKELFTNNREKNIYYSILVSSIIILILSYSIQPIARFIEYYRIVYIVLYIKVLSNLNNSNKLILFLLIVIYCTARLNSFLYQFDNGFEYIFHGI